MAVQAMKLGDGSLEFTLNEAKMSFSGQSTKTLYSPEYKVEDPTDVLNGEQYQEPGKLSGKISGELLQDYGTNSLLVWCHEHAGEIAQFEFVPNTAGALQISGECMITPVDVGGDVAKTNSASYEFPVVGKAKFIVKGAITADSH